MKHLHAFMKNKMLSSVFYNEDKPALNMHRDDEGNKTNAIKTYLN
jgi:hypothetical protein